MLLLVCSLTRQTGRIDFFVNDNLMFGIELMVRGTKTTVMRHLRRFKPIPLSSIVAAKRAAAAGQMQDIRVSMSDEGDEDAEAKVEEIKQEEVKEEDCVYSSHLQHCGLGEGSEVSNNDLSRSLIRGGRGHQQ